MLLSHSRHLDLSLPSNSSKFLSICLLTSPLPIALDTPCCTAYVMAAVMFAVSGWIVVPGIGDCTAVLVLVGANSPFVSPCGGVAVGWYSGLLLLFGGLSLVLLYLLQALVPWFDVAYVACSCISENSVLSFLESNLNWLYLQFSRGFSHSLLLSLPNPTWETGFLGCTLAEVTCNSLYVVMLFFLYDLKN